MLTSPPSRVRVLLGAFAVASYALGGCATADTTGDGTGGDDTGAGAADTGAFGLDGGSDTGGPGSGRDSGATTDTGATPGSDTGTSTCAPKCLRNYDCETTCAKPSGSSLNCCDTATGTCYVSSSTCPVPTGSDSGPPPAY